MRRSIGTTAVIAALALAATACGGGDDGDNGSNGSGSGSGGEGLSGTVTFWDTSNETEAEVFRAVAEEFSELHPDVTVDYVNIGWDGAQDRFKNAAGANEAPDVMRTEVAWVSDFANLGYLAPLDDTPAVEDQGDFLEQAWASTQFNDTTYAVPQVIDTLALFYNKELLDAAGVEVPENLEDIKASTEAFTEQGLEAPFYLRGDDAYWFLPYIYGEGGDLVDADTETVTIDDASGVAAFEAVQDLLDSGAAITDTTDGWQNMMGAFGEGSVAMMINGPWAINDARDAIGEENLGVAPVPAGGSSQGAPQGGWNYGVYAGSANLDASYEFVAYMASAETQQRITEELSLLPTRSSVYDVDSVANNEMVEFFAPAVEVAHERAWIPEANSLFDPLREEVESMLLGRATAEETANAVGDRYRDLLDWQ
ncbi:extracellular solute-binding protein [Streptomyces alkaliphilus]|uniref:extracellular solute-binding protein n=1 Tax=Streptomyces alkaliphilus TaxID=1472722 RepID=UPI00117EEBEE|nr:extracellular solute-binding protein [Streptomyces alkaliphilus]MQS06860.1 extracellular solute-binding protein [Streptomyces alkaliphilus]